MVQTPVQSPTFLQDVREIQEAVDASLARYVDFDDGCPDRLREAIRHSLLGPGKRLRPMLVLLAAEACGGDRLSAMPAACAVEMVHAYSLIHDDLPAMDDDDLRRGRPSCHAAFGEANAILAGDALLALAFEALAGGVKPPQTAAACCVDLAAAAGATALVGGQADDLMAERSGGGIDQLESIHRRKTGAMITVSLRLGAMAAGGNERQTAALEEYGEKLGLAFQIVDDLLDARGDEAVLGKRTGKDAQRGKLTFPGLLGVEESSRKAEELVREACAALVPLGPRAARLDALAQYVLERNR